MNENETRLLIKQMESTNLEARHLAWDELAVNRLDHLRRFFRYLVDDEQEAHRLTNDFYLKIHKHLQRAPLQAFGSWGYILTSAKHMAIDQQRIQNRRQSREFQYEHPEWYRDERTPSPEEEYELKELGNQARGLVLHIPSHKDRLLMLLYLADIKPKQIPSLFPAFRSKRTVYRHLEKIEATLKQQIDHSKAILVRPSDWEAKLSFIGVPGPFTVCCFNTLPRNLAPESKQELCKIFGLKTYSQIAEVCFPILGLHNVKTLELEPRILFLPRAEVNWGIRRGRRIHYLDARPVFRQVNGSQQDLLYLEDIMEYPSWMSEEIYDDQDNLMGSQWIMDLPSGRTIINKAFDLQKHEYFYNPQSQKEAVFVFQSVSSAFSDN